MSATAKLSGGKFHKLSVDEFVALLQTVTPARRINAVHLHHTWKPRHRDYRGIDTIVSMWRFHTETQGWKDIAQHLSIAPDGSLWTGRHWDLRARQRRRPQRLRSGRAVHDRDDRRLRSGRRSVRRRAEAGGARRAGRARRSLLAGHRGHPLPQRDVEQDLPRHADRSRRRCWARSRRCEAVAAAPRARTRHHHERRRSHGPVSIHARRGRAVPGGGVPARRGGRRNARGERHALRALGCGTGRGRSTDHGPARRSRRARCGGRRTRGRRDGIHACGQRSAAALRHQPDARPPVHRRHLHHVAGGRRPDLLDPPAEGARRRQRRATAAANRRLRARRPERRTGRSRRRREARALVGAQRRLSDLLRVGNGPALFADQRDPRGARRQPRAGRARATSPTSPTRRSRPRPASSRHARSGPT